MSDQRAASLLREGKLADVIDVTQATLRQFPTNLDARILLNEDRLRALWPEVDVDLVREHLDAVPRICMGDPAAGPIAKLSQRERFHWLTSPRSTIIQPSPVHTGVCDNTEGVLDRRELLRLMGLGGVGVVVASNLWSSGCATPGAGPSAAAGSAGGPAGR